MSRKVQSRSLEKLQKMPFTESEHLQTMLSEDDASNESDKQFNSY